MTTYTIPAGVPVIAVTHSDSECLWNGLGKGWKMTKTTRINTFEQEDLIEIMRHAYRFRLPENKLGYTQLVVDAGFVTITKGAQTA